MWFWLFIWSETKNRKLVAAESKRHKNDMAEWNDGGLKVFFDSNKILTQEAMTDI